MKQIQINPLLKFSSIAFALVLTSGCGQSELDTAGINTGADNEASDIVYTGISNLQRKFRVVGYDETTQLNINRYYFQNRADYIADYTHTIQTQPVVGLSPKDAAPIEVISVQNITGSWHDPFVIADFDTRYQQCLEDNVREQATYDQAYALWEENAKQLEYQGITPAPFDRVLSLDDCEKESVIFGRMGYVPTENDVEVPEGENLRDHGMIQYRLRAWKDVNSGNSYGLNTDYRFDASTFPYLSIIELAVDLNDEQWNSAFKAIVNIAGQEEEFILTTATRNPVVEVIKDEFGAANFLQEPIKNHKPGRLFTSKPISFSGFNTQAPVLIERTSSNTDFVINYSLEGKSGTFKPLPLSGKLAVRKSDELVLQIETVSPEDAVEGEPVYDREYAIKLSVGESLPNSSTTYQYEDEFKLTTHAENYVPGPIAHWTFPTGQLAVKTATIEVRGTVHVSADMLEYDDPEAEPVAEQREVSAIKFYMPGATEGALTEITPTAPVMLTLLDDPITVTGDNGSYQTRQYLWSTTLPVQEGFNKIYVKAQSNLVRSNPLSGEVYVGESEPLLTQVTSATAGFVDAVFPAGTSKGFVVPRDLTLNTTDNTFNILDEAANDNYVVWKLPSDGGNLSCEARIFKGPNSGARGIQFFSPRPEVGGLILSFFAGNSAYYSEATLAESDGGTTAVKTTGGSGSNGVQAAGHLAFSKAVAKNGSKDRYFFYLAGGSRGNKQENQQGFIFEHALDVEGEIADSQIVTNTGNGNTMGRVATDGNDTTIWNNGVSLDILSVPVMEAVTDTDGITTQAFTGQYAEYALLLEIDDDAIRTDNSKLNGDTGLTNLRKLTIDTINGYPKENDADRGTELLTLKDENQQAISLLSATSVAISQSRQKAYIADTENDLIYEVDLKDIATSNELPAKVIAAAEDGKVGFTKITGMMIEGEMDYLVAVDRNTNALIAIDLETYERGYLFKGVASPDNNTNTICN